MKEILIQLQENKTLSSTESKQTLLNIIRGDYNPTQIASFLSIFQIRLPNIEEIKGFRDAMFESCIKISFDDNNTIDLCGTGGDRKNTFNISTLASFVVAGTGVKVTKHGNYGITSGCGSSNIMEYFGYHFSNDTNKLQRELDEANICFLHAPIFHPAMKNIAGIRKELATKTFFNILGPMVNPSSPKHQLIGVSSMKIARLYHYLYQETDKNYRIIHNLDGYDEISLTNYYKIYSNETEELVDPQDKGYPVVKGNEIRGGKTMQESANIFMSILKGEGTNSQNNVVIANAAEALQVMYPDKSYETCKEMAIKSLYEKKAYKSFKSLLII